MEKHPVTKTKDSFPKMNGEGQHRGPQGKPKPRYVESPTQVAQTAGESKQNEVAKVPARKPPAVGRYHGIKADGRLRVELGEQRFLVVGALYTNVNGGASAQVEWSPKATHTAPNFDANSPWNWTVLLEEVETQRLVRVVGMFSVFQGLRKDETPTSGTTKPIGATQEAGGAKPVGVQTPRATSELPAKPHKGSKSEPSDDDYARLLKQATDERAHGLDPQVPVWFALRFLGVSRSGLYRQQRLIEPEVAVGKAVPFRPHGSRRFFSFSSLIDYRQVRMGKPKPALQHPIAPEIAGVEQ